MKFTRPELAHQYAVRLHFKALALAEDFVKFSKGAGLPEPICTDISRDEDFYEEEGLPPKKFSWHFVDCALDLRTRHYTKLQLATVIGWWVERCRSSEWELVTKLHGTGPHIHVAYKEFGLRRKWEAKKYTKEKP